MLSEKGLFVWNVILKGDFNDILLNVCYFLVFRFLFSCFSRMEIVVRGVTFRNKVSYFIEFFIV